MHATKKKRKEKSKSRAPLLTFIHAFIQQITRIHRNSCCTRRHRTFLAYRPRLLFTVYLMKRNEKVLYFELTNSLKSERSALKDARHERHLAEKANHSKQQFLRYVFHEVTRRNVDIYQRTYASPCPPCALLQVRVPFTAITMGLDVLEDAAHAGCRKCGETWSRASIELVELFQHQSGVIMNILNEVLNL